MTTAPARPRLVAQPSPEPDAVAFPPGFLWGTATAAFQVEGAAHEDGRTDSIWDVFCREPGAVVDGDTGETACDHYHRMPDDVALMGDLHLGAYRFSTSWARVCPDGGALNPAGAAFYDRLVDELLGAGVRPWLTLYHWDLPQTLEDAGGWTNRDTAHRFAEYAQALHGVLGDRVPTWTTLNEPWCAAFLGYTAGRHAPGRREGAAGLVAAHHLLLGHGLAVDALRAGGAEEVGITLNLTVASPADPAEPRDVDAARRVDAQQNRFWLDGVLRGRYPADLMAETAHHVVGGVPWAEHVREGDLEVVSRPIDVLGVNYYFDSSVAGRGLPEPDDGVRHPSRPASAPWVDGEHISSPSRGLPRTGIGWEIRAEGMTQLLRRLHDEYDAPPIYLTENGAAYPDAVDADGRVDDHRRIAYLDAHLRAVHAAMRSGVDVRGYFAWSLLDNFEWAYGYGQRFGLVHVDYATQVRTPKASAHWYAEVARTGRLQGGTPPGGPPAEG